MSRLQIPISHRTLYSTGDVCLWADIELLLKDDAGNFVPETFRVDTGTEITTFPAYRAKELNLPLPQQANPGATHAQTGLEVRSGYLRFRIQGLDTTEYVIPTFFLGDPDTPPDPNRPTSLPRKLLQPFSLLERLRFVMDRDPSDGTTYGTLTVEKK